MEKFFEYNETTAQGMNPSDLASSCRFGAFRVRH